MKYLWLLILVGCGGMTTKELEHAALVCEPEESSECLDLQRRYEWSLKKRERIVKCPEGYVLVKRHTGNSCVEEDAVREGLRRIFQTQYY